MSALFMRDWSLSNTRALRLILAEAKDGLTSEEHLETVDTVATILDEAMEGGDEELFRVVTMLSVIAINAMVFGYDNQDRHDPADVIKVLEADLLKRLDEIAQHDGEVSK